MECWFWSVLMNKIYKVLLCFGVVLSSTALFASACTVSVNRMTVVETDPNTGIPTEQMLSCAKKRDNPNFRAKLQNEFCTPNKINALEVDEFFKQIVIEGVVATSERILKAIEDNGHFDKFYSIIDPKNHKRFGALSLNEILNQVRTLTLNATDPEKAFEEIVSLVKRNSETLGAIDVIPGKDPYELRRIEDALDELTTEERNASAGRAKEFANKRKALAAARKLYFEKRLTVIRNNLSNVDKPVQNDTRRVAALAYIKSDPNAYNLFSWMIANGIKPFKGAQNLAELKMLIDVCNR
jgi:hypothetical protein